MWQLNDEHKAFLGCVVGSVVAYNGIRYLCNSYKKRTQAEFFPVGVIKDLFIFPAKSCKGKRVFSFHCGPKGAQYGEMDDRHLIVFDGDTGTFYTARQKPQMVLIDIEVKEDVISVTLPDGRNVRVKVSDVLKRRDVRPIYLFQKARQDGLDCGDDISRLLSDFLEETNVRLAMYISGLHNERICKTQSNWWMNNPVPQRSDEVAFEDLCPYMIMTQGSLDELNKRLENKVDVIRFRPEIFIDRCAPWDEDKWDSLKIGDVELQCFRPCDRCVLTTVDPKTGTMDPNIQPLKTLREFRLAPEGTMRKQYKESPLFGVEAGLVKPGYIHEGQVVYARYKKSVY